MSRDFIKFQNTIVATMLLNFIHLENHRKSNEGDAVKLPRSSLVSLLYKTS